MLILTILGVLFIVAVVGWYITHNDLIAAGWFKRHPSLRVVCAILPPLLGLGGADMIYLASCAEPCRWATLTIASCLGLGGAVLLITRPFRREVVRSAHVHHVIRPRDLSRGARPEQPAR